MESLQSWGFMGDIHIGYGFFRRKIAGNIMMLWRWFGVAFGVAESPEGDGPYGSPPGRSFCAYKRNQNTVKGDSFPLDEPLSVACSAGYERCKSIVRTAHRYAPKVAAGASAPYRLAVPEKNFALLACSFFSTAAGAPPRCIRHWRRSASHPLPLPRGGGGAVWANSCLFRS